MWFMNFCIMAGHLVGPNGITIGIYKLNLLKSVAPTMSLRIVVMQGRGLMSLIITVLIFW